MKKTLLAVLLAFSGTVAAQTSSLDTNASAGSQSDSGAYASTGAITYISNSSDRLKTAPPVYAAPLTAAGSHLCLGSTSGGVSVMGGGFSVGSTKRDSGCEAVRDATFMYQAGHKELGDLRMFCFGLPENRQAWEASGRVCPGAVTQAVASAPAVPAATNTPSSLTSSFYDNFYGPG